MTANIHKAPGPAQVKATLYFGANIPGGIWDDAILIQTVNENMFKTFLADHVTPHFPGFTLVTAEGYWKGEPETVRVLSIMAPDTGALRDQVRFIAEQYKTRFGQEAVAYDFTACQFTLDCWPYGPVRTYHKDAKGY